MKVLFLLSLAALLVYSNTFSVPFHYDDQLNIVDNPQVHSLADFTDFSGSRSVGFLSFALNYAAGGLNVFGYHLVNLLIHVANGFLVYWLVVLLFQSVIPAKAGIQSLRPGMDSRFRGNDVFGRSGYVALTTALLFIVHPIQTQAVTYVVQRLASLMTLFYLLAVVCYLKWRLFGETTDQGPGTRDQKLQVTGLFKRSLVTGHRSLVTGHWSRVWYVASLLSTLLAMKTKENSFTLPFMILLVEWVFFRPVRKKQWMALIPFLLTLLIVPFSMGAAPGEEQFAQQTMSLSRTDYLFTQFRVIVTYLRLLVLPINQNVDYGYPAYHSLFEPTVFASFLLLLSLFTPAVYLLFRPKSGTAPVQGNVQSSTLNFELLTLNFPLRLVSFGILWFFLALSVESSIFPIQDVMFEHRVYLPSVGFFMAMSVGLFGRNWLKTSARPALWTIVITVLVVISLGAAAWRRNFVWADTVTLWQDVVTKAPHNAKGHHNLGSEFGKRGRLEEAIREYKTALELEPNYPEARKNLGNAYALQGHVEEAIMEYNEALRLKPDYEEARKNLEYVVKNRGQLISP